MSENSEGQIPTEEDREAVKQYRVCSVSDDPRIRDIFRYEIWDVEKGIDYLIGIFDYFPGDEAHGEQLETLDGTIYTVGQDAAVIEYLCNLHDRLRAIWRHSRKKDKYTPGYFIRWGLKLRDVFEISWLDDAQSKGLVSDKWLLKPANPSDFDRLLEDKSLGKEKGYLLGVIAGLYYARYSQSSENTTLSVQNDLDLAGITMDKRTVKGHLLDAMSLLVKPIADKKLKSN